MVVVEIIGVIGFAGLISAWAVWIYPAIRGEKKVTPQTMIFTQGQCAMGLLPSDKDQKRIDAWKEKSRRVKASGEDTEKNGLKTN